MATKILLIEDDMTVRENTAEILELSDYQVQTASDGIKGVEEAKNFKPDIIVCDIMMPELDGYGVLEHLYQLIAEITIYSVYISLCKNRP